MRCYVCRSEDIKKKEGDAYYCGACLHCFSHPEPVWGPNTMMQMNEIREIIYPTKLVRMGDLGRQK